MKKPNFFMVGAPKCGTTALFSYFSEHPDIAMCERKEPCYFCTDFRDESDEYHKGEMRFPIRTEKEYLQLFKNADREKIVGEATPEYLYSKVAAQNLYDFNPAAKILILIREPVDFLYSIHSQMCFFAGESIVDFKEALDMEPKRRAGSCLPNGLLWPSSLYYSERVRFSEQIERYVDAFPREQIKIVLYDDFKKDNLGIYRSILEFLSVDTGYEPPLKSKNVNKTVRSKSMQRLFMVLSDLPMKNILPAKFRYVLARKIKAFNMKTAERSPLDPQLRIELMKKLKPEVTRLSELVDRDLTQLWGYDRL